MPQLFVLVLFALLSAGMGHTAYACGATAPTTQAVPDGVKFFRVIEIMGSEDSRAKEETSRCLYGPQRTTLSVEVPSPATGDIRDLALHVEELTFLADPPLPEGYRIFQKAVGGIIAYMSANGLPFIGAKVLIIGVPDQGKMNLGRIEVFAAELQALDKTLKPKFFLVVDPK